TGVQTCALPILLNFDEAPHMFRIRVSGMQDVRIVGNDTVALGKGEARELPLRLSIDPALLRASNNRIEFEVEALDDTGVRAETESSFIGPRIGRSRP